MKLAWDKRPYQKEEDKKKDIEKFNRTEDERQEKFEIYSKYYWYLKVT